MNAENENPESKYEVREVIGKGAFGEVNLVVEKQTKQRYVLKRIKMARQSEWQRRATRQEIEIVSRLRHPFIMPYREHWTHHGHTINVVYGYCEKGDLTTAINKQRGKHFSEETLRLWLAELLLAVDYMHRQNVLHRDIKTQNILLTGDGDVQIGDFGLSTVRVPSGSDVVRAQQQFGGCGYDTDACIDSSPCLLDTADLVAAGVGAMTPEPTKGGHYGHPHHNTGHDSNANGHGDHKDREKDQMHGYTPVHDPKAGTRNDYALVGTPHFMSPELLSSQKYSYETDIWSLGVVMYELTTLKPPFNAFNLAGLVAKIKRAALPPIPPSYSADWTSILKSMLRKDPTRRANPLELLAVPSMQQAVKQAYQRALAISPDFVMPDIPLPPPPGDVISSSTTPGFCFDVGGVTGAAAGQRTPSATGAATPVLVQSTAIAVGMVGDEACEPDDMEASPLSKFPDLSTRSSPLPRMPPPVTDAGFTASIPTAAVAAQARSPAPPARAPAAAPAATAAAATTTATAAAAATQAEPSRSKTPATSRRPGVGVAGATSGVAAARCAPSPQRARTTAGAVPAGGAAAGGPTRSKTPGRGLGTAPGAAKAEEAPAAPASRLVRKPSMRETATTTTTTGAARSRTAASAAAMAANTSPRDTSAGSSAATATTETASARAISPGPFRERPLGLAGHRGGPTSGTTGRVATMGSARATSGTASRKTVLDPPGHTTATASAHAVPMAVAPISAPPPRDNDSEVTTPDTTSISKVVSSPSSAGVPTRSSPGAPAAAGGRTKDPVVPSRGAARSSSYSTARTTRAALAAAAASPRGQQQHTAGASSSPTNGASGKRAGATGLEAGPPSASVRRPAAAATTTAADVAGHGTIAMGGAGAKRITAAGGDAPAAARGVRTAASPARPTSVPPRRKSQSGATALSKEPSGKEVPEPASTARPGDKPRVRRLSYISYGSKPAGPDSATQRRTTGITLASAVANAPAGAVAVVTTTSGHAGITQTAPQGASGPKDTSLSSHPLSASDAAADSCPSSTSANSPEMGSSGAAGVAGDASGGGREPVVEGTKGAAGCSPIRAPAPVQGSQTAAAVAVGGGGGHPWRSAPRSRSLMSMTTEDSELSIPDGRYGVSETSALCDNGEPAAGAGAALPTSPLADAGSLPHWSSNQLFSGSYGSCGAALADAAAAAAAAAPPGGVSELQSRPSDSLAGTASATLAADLPRRVSASAFAPHLLYAGAAAAAMAATGGGVGDLGGADSESSTAASSPAEVGLGRMVTRRLTVNDSGRAGLEGEASGAAPLSPAFDMASVSPSAHSAATTLSPSALVAASPRFGADAVSPRLTTTAALLPQQQRRYQPAESPVSQYRRAATASAAAAAAQQRRSSRTLDGRLGAASSGGGASGGAVHATRLSPSGAASSDATSLGSTGSAPQRGLAGLAPSPDSAFATPTGSVTAADVTSPLRPVAEEGSDAEEVESAPAGGAAAVAALLNGGVHPAGAGASGLSVGEREQLMLLQRVVSLASSLWEAGRMAELGEVLSSTLARPLEGRSGTVAAAGQARAQERPQAPPQQQQFGALPEPGDVVCVTAGPLRGTEAVVRYRGPCHWGAGIVLGLELQSPAAAVTDPLEHGDANTAGCRDGVRYFRCHDPASRAAFVSLDHVVKLG